MRGLFRIPSVDIASHSTTSLAEVLSSEGGTRTPDTRIMIPMVNVKTVEKHAHSDSSAAAGAAVDTDLLTIVEQWPELPSVMKAGILAMVRAVGR